jgi:hypothetical protein
MKHQNLKSVVSVITVTKANELLDLYRRGN